MSRSAAGRLILIYEPQEPSRVAAVVLNATPCDNALTPRVKGQS